MNRVTEKGLRAVESLQVDNNLIYRTELIPLLDVTYTEYSVDGDEWHKDFVEEDMYVRTSVDNKATWVYYELTDSAPTNTFTDTPATATVGGIAKDTVFEGMSDWDFKHKLTHPFQVPVLSNFTSTQPPLVEVGTTLTGVKTFSWTFTNSGNIVPLSGVIKENGTTVASGIELTLGTVAVSLTIDDSIPISKAYTIEGESTEGLIAPSNAFSIVSTYPIFKGKASSATLTLPRPIASEIDITNNANRVVQISTGDLAVTIGAVSDDYDWVAVPTTSSLFTNWFISSFDLGSVGGSVSMGGNLFPDPETINLTSPNGFWSTIPYRVYITNYPSAISSVILKRN